MPPAGVIFLHCIPSTRPHLDDPPSISEGWGGRITDYRISASAWQYTHVSLHVVVSVSYIYSYSCVDYRDPLLLYVF